MIKNVRKLPKSWSSTLLLPKSSFPPRALAKDRPTYLQRCTDDLYQWQQKERELDNTFVLHDGPPYANGPLHIGHALNKILKDITCRFQLATGRRVDYVPGWDCHGLPIEVKALEQLRKDGKLNADEKPSPVLVRKAARQLAAATVETQKSSFQEWSIMADWNKAWKTMDTDFEMKQLGIFKNMVKDGFIHRRYRPVYWSPSSRTALAEAELEYKVDHVSTAAYIKYSMRMVVRGQSSNVNAVVWTTTPWTLPANRAIAVNENLIYLILQSSRHGFLLLAESRSRDIETLLDENFTAVDRIRGSELVGLEYQDPLFAEKPPVRQILSGDFVSAEAGSGLVHLAPGHGMEDYKLCQNNGIPVHSPVDDDGCFNSGACPDHPELLIGQKVLDHGINTVLDQLLRTGMLLHRQQHKHKYPYDWRSKQPVIVRATEQWFADVGKLQDMALDSLDRVRFVPLGGHERLKGFLKSRSEWCISRQRAWGVPIPALYDVDNGTALMNEHSVTHIIETMRKRGTDAWWSDADNDPEWTPPPLRDDGGQTKYRRGKDTLDVWFDSGTSWTQMTHGPNSEEHRIADVYLEGQDQHRGWFQSSLLTRIAQQSASNSKAPVSTAPYKTLVTHGFTLDSTGRKMSKSIGNVVSPSEIMEGTLLPPAKKRGFDAQGPDALRLWVASCDFTSDVRLSPIVLQAVNGSLSKYRVTFKFLLGALADFAPRLAIQFDKMSLVHRIALIQLRDAYHRVYQHFQEFEYSRAIGDINKYVNTAFSAFYVETIKDALYADSGVTRQEAQSTLLLILRALQMMLGPATPMLVEESWDYTPKQIRQWFQHPLQTAWDRDMFSGCQDAELEEDLPALMQANTAIKNAQELARGQKLMGSSLESFVTLQLGTSKVTSSRSAIQVFERYHSELETLFVVSGVRLCATHLPSEVSNSRWQRSSLFHVNGEDITAWVYQPLDAKCVRCWRHTAPAGAQENDALCRRCEGLVQQLQHTRPDLFETREDTSL